MEIQEEFKDIEKVEIENVEEVGSKVTKDDDEKDFIEIIEAGDEDLIDTGEEVIEKVDKESFERLGCLDQ